MTCLAQGIAPHKVSTQSFTSIRVYRSAVAAPSSRDAVARDAVAATLTQIPSPQDLLEDALPDDQTPKKKKKKKSKKKPLNWKSNNIDLYVNESDDGGQRDKNGSRKNEGKFAEG